MLMHRSGFGSIAAFGTIEGVGMANKYYGLAEVKFRKGILYKLQS
jgi:hypothetical protein